MLYMLLAYHDQDKVAALADDELDKVMAGLDAVKKDLAAEGKLGPFARLRPTSAATTVRFEGKMPVIDGPFAETKEQLLGFYVLDCATLEDAIDAARRLAGPRAAAGLPGCFEVRPLLSPSLEMCRA
ncbi:MAG TPA: YciI family protein [Vineibacter sp.]|nr:YciI family protein [Vineibacter sp.]